MQSKALVFSGVRGDTRRYRALHLLEQLQLLNVNCAFAHLTDFSVDIALNKNWDLVVFHRLPLSKHLQQIIEKLQAKGTIIISDFDDLIFDPGVFQYINSPDFADPVRSSIYLKTMNDIRATLNLSEGVTASTNYLADQIRAIGKPVWIHRNAFSYEMLSCAEAAKANKQGLLQKDNSRVVIGYASGTPTHNRDFETIRSALKEVLSRYPNAELCLIGPLDPGTDWGPTAGQIRRMPLVPWRKLPEVLASFDINLAPLVVDNPFSQSKSEIKYMEAAMVSVPTIASPTDAFCYAIRSGENGFLASEMQDWVNTLSTLIEDRKMRQEIGERAREEVHKNYHPVKRAAQLADHLDEIRKSFRDHYFWDGDKPKQTEILDRGNDKAPAIKKFVARYEKDPSYIKMGLYYLRRSGFRATVRLVWIYMRRMIAPIFPFRKIQ
jgi:glycosyltransferase involved in cell wall biosynthesis